MSLGIVVVYVVRDRDERLLDLHLERIARHTSIPFTVFGVDLRLSPRLRAKLESHDFVRLCPPVGRDDPAGREFRGYFETSVLPVVQENSYYLELGVRHALAQGVSHVALLHPDSFPVRDGWFEDLATRLSPRCPLVAVRRDENNDRKPHPSFYLFERSFYESCQPRFLLTDEERRTTDYRRYQRIEPHLKDTGTGYGFALFRNGLKWYPLPRSNRAGEHYLIGSVYGDTVFHLGAAARHDKFFYGDLPRAIGTSRLWGAVRSMLPSFLRRTIPQSVRGPSTMEQRRQAESANQLAFERIRERLLGDPDGYLDYLRRGAA